MSNIHSKISRALFTRTQITFYLPKDKLPTLYFSLIHPHLTYGILTWGSASTNLLNKTTILKKRALRAIYNKKYNSHTDLYQHEVMLFMYDYTRDK